MLGADIALMIGFLGLVLVARDEGEQGGAAEAVLLRVQLLVVFLQHLDKDELALLQEDIGSSAAVGEGD